MEFLDGIDSLGIEDANYGFTFTPTNPIPTSGFIVISVPENIKIPASPTDLALTCISVCDD